VGRQRSTGCQCKHGLHVQDERLGSTRPCTARTPGGCLPVSNGTDELPLARLREPCWSNITGYDMYVRISPGAYVELLLQLHGEARRQQLSRIR
jgi:hypothetical protein